MQSVLTALTGLAQETRLAIFRLLVQQVSEGIAGGTLAESTRFHSKVFGTVLAFMMSVIALSAPEMVILRRVLKPRLIATFAGVVALGILIVGFVFNAVL